MAQFKLLLQGWIGREPAVSIWLAITALLVFGITYSILLRRYSGRSAWLRSLVGSLAQALLFLAIAGMVYFLLSSGFATFMKYYGSYAQNGSLSNQAWLDWNKRYGGAFFQQDLEVVQSVRVDTVEEVTPTDPSGELLYRHRSVEQPIEQSSIASFDGKVTLILVDPSQQPDSFNAFVLTARYEYEIVNPVDTVTHVVYRFPLAAETRLYQDIRVQLNGQEAPSWHMDSGAITWETHMQPGQKDRVSIHYQSRGMDSYVFYMPAAREVTHSKLTLEVNTDYCCLHTAPEDGGVQVDTAISPPYHFITWTIDRSILAARLGVDLRQSWPYAPYQKLVDVLPNAARASLLFLTLLILTLLICSAPVDLGQVALTGGLFMVPFLMIMAGGVHPAWLTPEKFSDFQVGLLPMMAVPILVIGYFVLRKLPRLPRILILALMALFLVGYPLSGLIRDEQSRNAFTSIVQAGMIAYIFLLALILRVRNIVRPKALPKSS
jgi:hypothetical protein